MSKMIDSELRAISRGSMRPAANKRGGFTYFRRWGFSINESQFPNIHISWRRPRGFFYVAIKVIRPLRLWFSFPCPFGYVGKETKQ